MGKMLNCDADDSNNLKNRQSVDEPTYSYGDKYGTINYIILLSTHQDKRGRRKLDHYWWHV